MEFFIFVAVFIGVIAVTALLFGGWAVVTLIKALVSGVRSLVAPPRRMTRPDPARRVGSFGTTPAQVRCMRPRCHGDNPPGARFCRRCGATLTAGATVQPAGRLSAPSRQTAPPIPRVAPAREAREAKERVTL